MTALIHCKGTSIKRMRRNEVKRKRRAKLIKNIKRVFLGENND